jgi:hypothetical protein
MGLLAVIGVVAVVLLWKILGTQNQRAQLEAARFVIDSATAAMRAFEQRNGTAEQAIGEGRLIDWYEALARDLRVSDESIKTDLCKRQFAAHLHALLAESVTQRRRCRFLEEDDYASLETVYPGPEPRQERVCGEYCDASVGVTLSQDIDACPFCGRPTGVLGRAADFEAEMTEWRAADKAWQVWKMYAPAKANAEEKEWRTDNERQIAEDRAEYEQALAAHRSRK